MSIHHAWDSSSRVRCHRRCELASIIHVLDIFLPPLRSYDPFSYRRDINTTCFGYLRRVWGIHTGHQAWLVSIHSHNLVETSGQRKGKPMYYVTHTITFTLLLIDVQGRNNCSMAQAIYTWSRLSSAGYIQRRSFSMPHVHGLIPCIYASKNNETSAPHLPTDTVRYIHTQVQFSIIENILFHSVPFAQASERSAFAEQLIHFILSRRLVLQ